MNSITRKIIFLLLFITFIGSIITQYLNYNFHFSTTNQLVDYTQSKQIEIFAKSLAHPMYSFNKEAIRIAAEGLVGSSGNIHIGKVEIYNEANEIILQTVSRPEHFNKLDYAKVESNIYFEREHLGKVVMFFDSTQIGHKIKSNLIEVLFYALMPFLILSLGVWALFHKLLGKPINLLLQMVKDFEKGVIPESRNLEKLDMEFKKLGDHFFSLFNKIWLNEEQLKKQNENLEKLVDLKTKEILSQKSVLDQSARLAALGEFAGNVAHEINNPLAVIQGHSSIIKGVATEINNSKIISSSQKIIAMVERIVKTVQGLKKFARDGQNDNPQFFSALKFFDDIKDLVVSKLSNLGVEFSVEMPKTDFELYGREVPLSQVFVNLIHNSADAVELSAEKWVKIKVSLIEDKCVEILVRDSGDGISEEVREKMMNPFFTTKSSSKGTGLGLSISLGIIKDHDGDFYYDENCSNTQFVIKLPLKRRELLCAS